MWQRYARLEKCCQLMPERPIDCHIIPQGGFSLTTEPVLQNWKGMTDSGWIDRKTSSMKARMMTIHNTGGMAMADIDFNWLENGQIKATTQVWMRPSQPMAAPRNQMRNVCGFQGPLSPLFMHVWQILVADVWSIESLLGNPARLALILAQVNSLNLCP